MREKSFRLCLKTRQPGVRHAGFALVVVLWVVMIAALIFVGVQQAARMNFALSHGDLAAVQARWLARAGVEQAIAILQDDVSSHDSSLDYWYEDAISFSEVHLGDGEFSLITVPQPGSGMTVRNGLQDQESLLSLNDADEKQLGELLELSPLQVDSIIDWRDQDQEARPQGAEGGHYQVLKYPYEIRNAPFKTPFEPLLVRGIDNGAFFGEDRNLNGVLDVNENDGDRLAPGDNADGHLKRGLAAYTTVYSYEPNKDLDGLDRVDLNQATPETLKLRLRFTDGLASAVVENRGQKRFESVMQLLEVKAPEQRAGSEQESDKVSEITMKWLAEHLEELTVSDKPRLPGRINVNTAPWEVLMTLPEMTSELADSIIATRGGATGPFRRVGQLLSSNTLNEQQFKACAERLTVRSNVFAIKSVGRTKRGVSRTINAVVDRAAEPMTILYWCESQ